MSLTNSTYLFGISPFVVGPVIGPATYTTISSALADAVSAGGSQTVYIQPAFYSENVTWPANLTIIGSSSLGFSTVRISGTQTFSAVGGPTSFSAISFENNTASPTWTINTGGSGFQVHFDQCSFLHTGDGAVPVMTVANTTGVYLNECTVNGNSDCIALTSNCSMTLSSSQVTTNAAGSYAVKVGNTSTFNVSSSTLNSNAGSCVAVNSVTAVVSSTRSSYNALTSAFDYSALGSVSSMYDIVTTSAGAYVATGASGLIYYSFMTVPGVAIAFAPTITAIPLNTLPPTTAFSWTSIAASMTLSVNTGYLVTGGAVVLTLPATSKVGDLIDIVLTSGTSWRLALLAGQKVRMGPVVTVVGTAGNLFASTAGDSVSLVCDVANTSWTCYTSQGNILIT